MNAKIKIPKGWRKLRRGSIIRKGDRFVYIDGANLAANRFVGAKTADACLDYGLTIRRITRPAKRRGKKK